MTTALGIITSSMRKIGALTKNEAPTSDEANDGLEMLNDILASWSNDSMLLYARTLENFPLSGGVQSYTIGSGADFDTTRPMRIVSAYVRSGTIDYPLTVITDENFANITLKTTGSIPELVNYDNNYPIGTLKFYPVPTGDRVYLLTEKPLTSFTLNQTVNLPPGWKRALIYNLAVDMSSEYAQPVSNETAIIANQSKGEIKTAIMRNRTADWNNFGRVENIYTGWNT